MSTLDATQQEILVVIAGFIREVIGEDAEDIPIAMETSFADDLEIESIEIVALAEKIQERWGEELDFAGWLSSKELDEIIQLRVGDLVEYIAACT